MRDLSFESFLERLLGDWVGHRRSATVGREPVRSQWRAAFDGTFLHERWHTAGDGASPRLTAEAFFRVSESGPADFIAVYRDGRIAFGESTFGDAQWTLTHRWLRDPGIAEVRLRFVDDESYEQEVFEITADGDARPESVAVLERERSTT